MRCCIEQPVAHVPNLVNHRVDLLVTSPCRYPQDRPAQVSQDAVTGDVLAPPLASGVEVLIAVDFDVQSDPLFHQRKVQLVSLHIELGMGNIMRRQLRTAPSGSTSEPEPIKRLSINLPESLHTRFRTACSATNRKMITEIRRFVACRTEELEDEAGLTDRQWATQLSKRAQRRLEALDRASGCNHPTGDIDEMLADIARGRDLR